MTAYCDHYHICKLQRVPSERATSEDNMKNPSVRRKNANCFAQRRAAKDSLLEPLSHSACKGEGKKSNGPCSGLGISVKSKAVYKVFQKWKK